MDMGYTNTDADELSNMQTMDNIGALGMVGNLNLIRQQRKAHEASRNALIERQRIAGEAKKAARSQASSVKKAADQQIDASNKMQETFTKEKAQVRTDLAPWRETGATAVKELAADVQAGPGEYTKSPGYEFGLEEGQKAITSSASQHGNMLSGKTMKAATKYSQDYASKDYDKFLGRYYQSLAPKQNLAQIGQSSAAQVGNLGQQTANMMGQAQQYAGESAAAGTVGAGNILAAQSAAAGERDYSYASWKSGRAF